MLVFACTYLCAAQATADLNAISTFYGYWQGEINFASFGEGEPINFQLAKASTADKILFITPPAKSSQKPDTIKCSFNEGVFSVQLEGKAIAGNSCPGVLQFSLLDADYMIASFLSEVSGCERISFRGTRMPKPIQIAGPQSPPRLQPSSALNRKSGKPFRGDNCAPALLASRTWSYCHKLTAQQKINRYGKGRVKIVNSKKLPYGGGFDYTFELLLDGGKKITVGPILANKNKTWINEFLGMDENANAFVFSESEQESFWVTLINRTSGAIMGSVDWANEGAEEDFSPDKTNLITYVKGLEWECPGGCQALYIHAIGQNITKTFSYDFDHSTVLWYPGAWRWLSNTVLEIDKLVFKKGKKPDKNGAYPQPADLEAGGKIWLVKTGNTWAFKNVNPNL